MGDSLQVLQHTMSNSGGTSIAVASTYHDVLFYMEKEGILDPEVDIDLFVFQCVFLPLSIDHWRCS